MQYARAVGPSEPALSARFWNRSAGAERVHAVPRERVILACEECHSRNYSLTKNKQLQPQRLEVRKFCPVCQKHTIHKETR